MSNTPKDETKKERGSFAATLATIRPGTDYEAEEKLRELLHEVALTGKGGTLTLKLDVKPAKAEGMVEVTDSISVRTPARKRTTALAFIGKDDELQKDDPNQHPLFDIAEEPTPAARNIREDQ